MWAQIVLMVEMILDMCLNGDFICTAEFIGPAALE